jgi:hypothetical protein
MSLSGAEQLNQKSIDVKVNLLAEWLESQRRFRGQLKRWLIVLLSIILLAVAILPIVLRAHLDGLARLRAVSAELASAKKALAAFEKDRASAQPIIEEKAMLETSRERTRRLIGNLNLILNAGADGMAFQSLRGEVMGGVLTVRCQGDAQGYSDVQAFLEAAGRGARTKSSLLASTRRSDLIGVDGIAFEYVKRVEVSP